MARPIILSNGELHVGLNTFGEVHDFYFPYVGLENHTIGKETSHHIGVWVDGKCSWLHDGSWTFVFSYPHDALVGHIVAKNQALGIMLEFDDTVDGELNAFMRNVHIVNLDMHDKDVRLFFRQAFVIGDSASMTDTAQFLPNDQAIVHYRGRRTFVISGTDDQKRAFDQYTIGLFGTEGREGTFRDAEDGELWGCPVEHGRVDSTIRFKLALKAHSSARIHYWIACGTTLREALFVHKQLRDNGLNDRYILTTKWWYRWLRPAEKVSRKIDPAYRELFLRSVMLLKAHIDKRGAIIASTDSGMLNYWRDAYAYCWPRDGAYVLWPLIRMGYYEEAYQFFDFCRRGLNSGGFLMHKYRADGAVGSSWHPYIHDDGSVTPPIQEDETALVLFLFGQLYRSANDQRLMKRFYEPMVVPMADFLASYIDSSTGLPKPSYDLWEEQYMTTTYTTAVVYAALSAAADLADDNHDDGHAVAWRSAASDIAEAAQKYLVNHDRDALYKGLRRHADGSYEPDQTIDLSSIYGAFMFGLFSADSGIVERAVQTARRVFNVSPDRPGVPRYENDNYRRRNPSSLGNWWFVTSLWLAQYDLEKGDVASARKTLAWVRAHARKTGTLCEQIDPETEEEESVSPLSWSQAEFVSTVLDTITKGTSK